MDRRRALLAASQMGGNGFYADFHFDYCEETFLSKFCYRASDDLGVACYNEIVRLIDEYGVQGDSLGNTHVVQNPINYGFEVYVEGALVTSILNESGTIFINFSEEEYSFTRVSGAGELVYEYE